MPYRSLAIVGSLSAGDYLVWNWAVAGNHDVEAIIAGLSLPMLLVVLAWMIMRMIGSLLNSSRRSPRVRSSIRRPHAAIAHSVKNRALRTRPASEDPAQANDRASSGKLAA